MPSHFNDRFNAVRLSGRFRSNKDVERMARLRRLIASDRAIGPVAPEDFMLVAGDLIAQNMISEHQWWEFNTDFPVVGAPSEHVFCKTGSAYAYKTFFVLNESQSRLKEIVFTQRFSFAHPGAAGNFRVILQYRKDVATDRFKIVFNAMHGDLGGDLGARQYGMMRRHAAA